MKEIPESPAAIRNGPAILEQLKRLLPERARILEIGSGWGQHAVQFAAAMPGWEWQASEQAGELACLEERCRREGTQNIIAPLELDVLEGHWPGGKFDAVYTANTAHIMPWSGVCAMLGGAAACLQSGGLLLLYGPFNVGGRFTAPSNAAFDRDLRRRDPSMGIRDLEAIEREGAGHHLQLIEKINMPANNFMLVMRLQGQV